MLKDSWVRISDTADDPDISNVVLMSLSLPHHFFTYSSCCSVFDLLMYCPKKLYLEISFLNSSQQFQDAGSNSYFLSCFSLTCPLKFGYPDY